MGLRTTSTGVAAPPRRRPTWRATRTAISLTALTSLLLACAPAAPVPAAPPSAPPSAPAAAPAPAAPAANPPAPPAANPAGPASGQITIVYESEPPTIVPKDTASNNGYFVLDNVYDHLVARDYSSGVAKLAPQLADSWSRVDDRTWRFKLHQGVKFTNGEVFNADAVVTAIADMTDPQKPGQVINEYGTLQSAARIDEFTADITTSDPDPILPERLVHFPIPAPNWLKTSDLTTLGAQAIGSGPYLLADYQKGQYLLFKANPNYWGPNKAKIAEIKMVPRNEEAVRAAMLQAGEVDLAFHIALDDAKKAPRTIIEQSQESVIVDINSEHPVMKDVRVRQAIAEAVDVQGIVNGLYPGGIAVPLTGQVVRQGTSGWNPELKMYPYNLDEAKQLMQDSGAVGTAVEYFDRVGFFPRSEELAELVANQLTQIGFKVTVRYLDAAAATEKKRATKPEQSPPDLLETSVSSPILDSSRIFDSYHVCGGRFRSGCDPEFDRRYTEAKALQGEARDKAFQGLWAYEYDKYLYLPLVGLNWAHGASTRLQWTPRIDGLELFTEMSLNP
jgi:peptide/nickel transport system substrate-binding protein